MITIYGTATCPPCHTIKDYLTRHDIPYTYIPAMGKEYEAQVKKATSLVSHPNMIPLVTDGKTIFTGLHWDKLKELIGVEL